MNYEETSRIVCICQSLKFEKKLSKKYQRNLGRFKILESVDIFWKYKFSVDQNIYWKCHLFEEFYSTIKREFSWNKRNTVSSLFQLKTRIQSPRSNIVGN